MPQRLGLYHVAVAILGGVVLLFLAVGTAEFIAVPGLPNVIRFTQAEFVPSNARRPPDDLAAWKTVSLPDQWRNRPDFGGYGWYRMKWNLDRAPEGLQGVFMRNRRARRIAFFINGKPIGSARDVASYAAGRAGRGLNSPLGYTVPPSMLRAGENVIHVRMDGSSYPTSVHGLGEVFFGEARALRRMRLGINEFNFQARRYTSAMALAAGIITFFLWFARRADRVMLWFAVTCLSWGAAGFLYLKLRWAAPVEITSLLFFYVNYGLVVPTLVLSLRTVDLKWPVFEGALWLFFLFELSYPLWPGVPWPAAYLAWDAVNMGLLLTAVGIVWYAAHRPLAWPIKFQLAALAAMAAFMGFEIARFLGWVDIESPMMRHYHVPMMLLAMGAACFERHARAIRQAESVNAELERRVAEKMREIETNHARIEDARRERALSQERQRILADMHDGLGATLVSLLRHVQGGHTDYPSVRGRVQEALQEMRAAIDALQPRGGDLTAIVASLRERLDGLISGSGMRLVWQVDDLPRVDRLSPTVVFSLQRIVLEAVGNTLKHSDAKEIRFVARAREDKEIEIRIEDDGRGFDLGQTRPGIGMANMQARAERMGASFRMTSRPGKGTVVQLKIPRAVSATPSEPAEVESKAGSETRWTQAPRIAGVALFATATLIMASHAPFLEAASPRKVIEFNRADFVQSRGLRPPDDSAPWKPVALPDQWRMRPKVTGPVWYRMRFHLDHVPKGLRSVFVRHLRAYRMVFFVNGKLIGAARDRQSMSGAVAGKGFGTPVLLYIPPALLRAGENVLHARVEASTHPARVDGLGRVLFGESRRVRRQYQWFNESGFSTKQELIYMTFTAGLIALLLWFARRSDRVLWWFSVTCLSWGMVGIVYLMWRWSAITVVSSFLNFYLVYGLVVPVVILSLRTVDLKWPRFEAALWLFFVFELTYPLWAVNWPVMHVVWDVANTGLLLAATVIMLNAARRPLGWQITVQLLALTTMAAVMFFEIARYLGWVDVESPVIRHYHVPLMLIAMGAACFDRYARAVREVARTTVELEHRVSEKVREIEANRAKVEAARSERALNQERQSILADMHEGLGEKLVGLLDYINTGRAETAMVERRVQEALQEMRAAIDALQPHRGDLTGVLGSLRERLDGLMAGSGVRLVWQVDELPQVNELKPSTVFSLQRIVFEAVGNATKRSGATELRFVARARENEDVEIRVEDNGQELDLAQPHKLPGIANMRSLRVRGAERWWC